MAGSPSSYFNLASRGLAALCWVALHQDLGSNNLLGILGWKASKAVSCASRTTTIRRMETGVIEMKEGRTTYDDIQNKKLFPSRCRQTPTRRREISTILDARSGRIVVTLQGRPYDVMVAG